MPAPPLSFTVTGLGCKVAQYDAEALSAELEERGLVRLDRPDKADILLVNTCTVTTRADYQARQLIRKLARKYPGARLVVTGCYAERDQAVLEGMAGVDLVVTRNQRERLGALLAGEAAVSDPAAGDGPPTFNRVLTRFGDRSRPFLKIQDGCDENCAYCIVPAVRGPSLSQPGQEVEAQLRQLSSEGFGEVVLSGVHLGRWGEDLPGGQGQTLASLLVRLGELALPLRYRLSSIEPLEFTDRLLETIRGFDNLARHFHLPLQSGSDMVLRAMNRPYTARQYGERVAAILSALPHACIGADVIVGFPGESESDFEDTLLLVSGLGLAYLHVFPFSPRPGTPAAGMAGRPHGDVVRERSRRLRGLSAGLRREFAARFVGTAQQVVVLSVDSGSGEALGLSGNYLQVAFPAADVRRRQLIDVRLLSVDVDDGRLTGRVVASPDSGA
jgi:threonylcarbamoyladenosine tRNA methylthiotransferase MtaB